MWTEILNPLVLLWIWLFVVSALAFSLTLYDKWVAASKTGRRISEKSLFICALAGGALSMFIAMKAVRHKTKHKRFMIGLPVIILAQTVLLYFILS